MHKEEMLRITNLTSTESGCEVGAVSVALPATVITPRGRNVLRYPITELPKMAIFPLQVLDSLVKYRLARFQ